MGQAVRRALAVCIALAMLALGSSAPRAEAPAEPTVAHWLEQLQSDDSSQQIEAIEGLQALDAQSAEVATALGRAARSSDMAVRYFAAKALRALGPAAAPAADDLVSVIVRADQEIAHLGEAGYVWPQDEAQAALLALGPAAMPAISKQISRSGPQQLLQLGSLLVSEGDAALPQLTAMLKHRNPHCRSMAVKILRRMGPPAKPAAPALRALLETSASETQVLVIRALVDIGAIDEAMLKVLEKQLAAPKAIVRVEAASVLWRHQQSKAARKVLAQELVGEDAEYAIEAIQMMGDAALPFLEELASGKEEIASGKDDEELSLRCTSYLSRWEEKAIPSYLKLLKHPRPTVRRHAIYSTAQIVHDGSHQEVLPALQKMLADPDEDVRTEAGWALWQLDQQKQVVPLLIRRLADTDEDTRREAVEYLAAMGPDALHAWPDVLRALGDEHSEVQYIAAEYFQKLDFRARPAAPELSKLLRSSPSGVVRVAAAKALLKLAGEDDTVVAALVDGLKDADRKVRMQVCQVLMHYPRRAGAAVPALAEIVMKAEDHDERVAGIEALREIRTSPEISVPALVAALESEDWSIRLKAVQALQRYGPRAAPAVPRLVELLGSGDFSPTAEVLGDIGTPAVPTLLRALVAPLRENEDRSGIVNALSCIGPAAIRAVPTIAKSKVEHSIGGRAMAEITVLDPAPLIGGLIHENLEVRQMTLMAVVARKGPLPTVFLDPVLARLQDSDLTVQSLAVSALAKAQPKDLDRVTKELLPFARNSTGAIHITALQSLSELHADPQQVLPLLVAALDAKETVDSSQQSTMLLSLAGYGPDAAPAVPALIRYLDHDELSRYATYALEKVGPAASSAVDPLLKKLRANRRTVNLDVAQALWSIARHPEALERLDAAVDYPWEEIADVFSTLQYFGPAAAPIAKKRLHDEDSTVRFLAASILWKAAQDPEARAEIRALITGEDDRTYARFGYLEIWWEQTHGPDIVNDVGQAIVSKQPGFMDYAIMKWLVERAAAGDESATLWLTQFWQQRDFSRNAEDLEAFAGILHDEAPELAVRLGLWDQLYIPPPEQE